MSVFLEYVGGKFSIGNLKNIANATNQYSVMVTIRDGDYVEISVYSNSAFMNIKIDNVVVNFSTSSSFKLKSCSESLFSLYNEIAEVTSPLLYVDDYDQVGDYLDNFHELFTKLIGESLKLMTNVYANINCGVPPSA
jgi:small nuclear ribonucleoprotein (snRNP)-like protein